MSDDHLSDVTADLRVTVTSSDPLHGSQSGARVHPVTRDNGRRAVLKVTTATNGAAREAAERELQLYLHLRPHLGVRTPQLLDYRESIDTIALPIRRHVLPLTGARTVGSTSPMISLACTARPFPQAHHGTARPGSPKRSPILIAPAPRSSGPGPLSEI